MRALVTGADRLGPFSLLEELGAGAMGTVYLAEDREEGRRVALKVIHPHLMRLHGFFKRFQREADLGSRVEHTNVVRTLDCDLLVVEDTPYCFLVMEYVEGQTLRQLLRDLGAVPEALVREIAWQTATGLAAIHVGGIVHRDLKPENILITTDHQVRIMDLGVARLAAAQTALTKEGQFAGSVLYAAPEQLRHQEVGAAADLYALGVLLHELVTGVNPFLHEDVGAVVQAHLEETPARITDLDPDLSPFFAEVIATLLAKKAEARFESAGVLAEVLEEGEGSSWWQARERALLEAHERRVRVPVRRETKVYGREGDLALLRAAWTKARAGDGNTVLLEGEAGIGKSRLVDAFLSDVDGEDAHVLYGSYPPSGGMGAITDALLEHFGRAALEDALRPYLTATPSLVPALAAVLRQEVPPEDAPSLQGDVLHAVLVRLMRALAAERPLVWVIEDLHFADADSRKLVLSLARAVAGHEELLVLTTRPELSEEDLANFGRLEKLRRTGLGRLGAREVIELLRDAFRSERLADKLGAKIAYKSDGVPFFVFEMIRGLKEGQFITQLPDGSWVESKVIEEIEVPSAVRDLIGVRLRDLTDDKRAILDVGAVQGFEFDPDLVAQVLGRPRVAILQEVAAIERRSGVLRATGRNARFDHHQIQEVLYDDLIPALREEYHSLLAEAHAGQIGASADKADELPQETAVFLTEHGLRGREPKDGLPYLNRALQCLEGSSASEHSLRLCTTALAIPDLLTDHDRIRLLVRSYKLLYLLGRPEACEALLEEASALAESVGDASQRAMVASSKGIFFRSVGRLADAHTQNEHALAICRELRDTDGEACATINLGITHRWCGNAEEALEHYERGRELARQCGNRQWEVNASGNLGYLLGELCRHEEARAELERALTIARESGFLVAEAHFSEALSQRLAENGHYDDAEMLLARVREIGQTTGSRRVEAGAFRGEAIRLRMMGRYEAAGEQFRKALALAEEIGEVRDVAGAHSNLANNYFDRGYFEPALAHYRRALASSEQAGDTRELALIMVAMSGLLVVLGRPDEAHQWLRRADGIAKRTALPRLESVVLEGLACLASSKGDFPETERINRDLLACRRDEADPYDLARSLYFLGDVLVEQERWTDAAPLLEEAEALSGEAGVEDLELQVLCVRARLPGGRPAEAQAPLAARESQLHATARQEAHFLLWRATSDPTHLTEAKRILDHLVEHAPEEYRESMLKNVRLNREIMEAWAEHGGGEPEEASDPS